MGKVSRPHICTLAPVPTAVTEAPDGGSKIRDPEREALRPNKWCVEQARAEGGEILGGWKGEAGMVCER